MFSYAELLSRRLKKRDFEFWAWKAQKELIRKEMLTANTVRIAMATQENYSQFFQRKQTELFRLDGKLEEFHRGEWEDLKRMKGG
jgi:hypothetical protein